MASYYRLSRGPLSRVARVALGIEGRSDSDLNLISEAEIELLG